MLKAWIKFKIWLIKKLGGFTEQNYIDGSIPQGTYNNCAFEVEIKSVRPEIIPIHISKSVINRDIEYLQETNFASLYSFLADDIGRYIVEHHLYHEYNEERLQTDSMKFEWTLWIVNPRDMINSI